MDTKKQSEMDALLARIYDAAFAAGYSKRDAELVRCADCSRYASDTETCEYDMTHRYDVAPWYFCALGQRKEDKA